MMTPYSKIFNFKNISRVFFTKLKQENWKTLRLLNWDFFTNFLHLRVGHEIIFTYQLCDLNAGMI